MLSPEPKANENSFEGSLPLAPIKFANTNIRVTPWQKNTSKQSGQGV